MITLTATRFGHVAAPLQATRSTSHVQFGDDKSTENLKHEVRHGLLGKIPSPSGLLDAFLRSQHATNKLKAIVPADFKPTGTTTSNDI